MKFPVKLVAYAQRVTLALFFTLASISASAQPANSIEAVDVSSQQGGKIIVKVTLRDAPANPPAGFMINNPPRIAFDFPNTTNALGRSLQDIGEGDLRKINLVQAGDRTRMVLELTKSVSYDTQIDGKSLLITLEGMRRQPRRPRAPLPPAASHATSSTSPASPLQTAVNRLVSRRYLSRIRGAAQACQKGAARRL